MPDAKIRKDLEKADADDLPIESKPRVDKPNTPHGHSDKIRQTTQG